MAQPRATAKRIKTEETNFPLRPHVAEWRQRKYTMIVPIKIAASATTGLGIASFTASVPFDVGSVTMEATVDSNQGVLGIREWAGIFGPAQAPVPSWTSLTHDFPRPVPIQGTKFTVDAWRTYNADVANGIWKDGSWAASATYGALRITFHRAD